MKTSPPFSPAAPAGVRTALTVVVGAGLLQALSAGWPATATEPPAATVAHLGLAQMAWVLQLLAAALAYAAVIAVRCAGPGQQLAVAAAFGLAWQAGGIWWLFIGLHKYAQLSVLVASTAVLALSAYLAAYSVLAFMAFWASEKRLVGQHAHPLAQAAQRALLFSAAWLLAELGRAMVMGGFPWAASAYAHLHGPLRHLAPWLGAYGSAALAVFLAALGVEMWRCRAQAPRVLLVAAAVLAGSLAALSWLPNFNLTEPAGEFEVSLLQSNVKQDEKFQPAFIDRGLNWHMTTLLRSPADLILTPETALPALDLAQPDGHWSRLRRGLEARQGVALVGMPEKTADGSYTNTLFGLGASQSLLNAPDGGVFRYHKHHLVPFAEFTPWGFAWFTRMMDLPLPEFARMSSAPLEPLRIRTRADAVQTIAPLICFEDLYGEELAQRYRDSANAPTAMANASNLAWFDNSAALAQHLRIAQYRSLELQRPTVRATNTGPTVVIDHHGQVIHALPPQTQGVLTAVVQGRKGVTPYGWWVSRTGLWPLVVWGVVVLAWPWWLFRRPIRSDERLA